MVYLHSMALYDILLQRNDFHISSCLLNRILLYAQHEKDFISGILSFWVSRFYIFHCIFNVYIFFSLKYKNAKSRDFRISSRDSNKTVSAHGNYGVASIILEKNIFSVLYRVPDRMTSFELTAYRARTKRDMPHVCTRTSRHICL